MYFAPQNLNLATDLTYPRMICAVG